MAVAKALGASRIIGVDIIPSRLDFAKKYAATHTYLPLAPEEGEGKTEYSRRNAADMKKQLGITDRGSGGIDLVIDASGAEASIQTGLYIAKSGGTFVQVGGGFLFFMFLSSNPLYTQVGMGNHNVTMNISLIITKELNYKGSFRYGVSLQG